MLYFDPPADELQEIEAVFQGRRFLLRSQLVGHAHVAIAATGVAVPPTLREGPPDSPPKPGV